MSDRFNEIKPRRLSDGAVDQILSLLKDGELAPGDKLPPERELIRSLSVSRTSLREAIRVLEHMGILRVVPGRGTFVAADETPSFSTGTMIWLLHHRDEALQLLEMHEALEVKVAALAAQRATSEDVREMRESMAEIREAVEVGDSDALAEADHRFHAAIAEASRNKIIAGFLCELGDLVEDTRHAIMNLPTKPERAVAEHEGILAAIEEGDADKAARHVLLHVRRSKDELAATVGGAAPQEPGPGMQEQEQEG